MKHIQPVIDALKASRIPSKHEVTIRFSIFTVKAREMSEMIRAAERDINAFVIQLQEHLILD